MLFAQLHTTSSATFHSYSHTGWRDDYVQDPLSYQFRSTSMQVQCNKDITYSYKTAPMQMATGTITTVASQLKGGVLADEIVLSESFIPTNPMRKGPGDGGLEPPSSSPLSETWDLWVVMALICTIYVLYHRYSLKKQ